MSFRERGFSIGNQFPNTLLTRVNIVPACVYYLHVDKAAIKEVCLPQKTHEYLGLQSKSQLLNGMRPELQPRVSEISLSSAQVHGKFLQEQWFSTLATVNQWLSTTDPQMIHKCAMWDWKRLIWVVRHSVFNHWATAVLLQWITIKIAFHKTAPSSGVSQQILPEIEMS